MTVDKLLYESVQSPTLGCESREISLDELCEVGEQATAIVRASGESAEESEGLG